MTALTSLKDFDTFINFKHKFCSNFSLFNSDNSWKYFSCIGIASSESFELEIRKLTLSTSLETFVKNDFKNEKNDSPEYL